MFTVCSLYYRQCTLYDRRLNTSTSPRVSARVLRYLLPLIGGNLSKRVHLYIDFTQRGGNLEGGQSPGTFYPRVGRSVTMVMYFQLELVTEGSAFPITVVQLVSEMMHTILVKRLRAISLHITQDATCISYIIIIIIIIIIK